MRCAKKNYVFFSFSLWSAFRLYMYFCVYILKMTINKKIYLFLCIGISTKWCVIFLLLTFLVNSSVWPAFIFVLFTTLKTSPFFISGLTFFWLFSLLGEWRNFSGIRLWKCFPLDFVNSRLHFGFENTIPLFKIARPFLILCKQKLHKCVSVYYMILIIKDGFFLCVFV